MVLKKFFKKGYVLMNLNVQNDQAYLRLTAWKEAHDRNMLDAMTKMNGASKSQKASIYESYLDNEEKIGLNFDFMDGKDPKNEDDYDKQIKALAQAEFDEKDANKDGKISWEEYRDNELKDLSENDGEEFRIMAKATAYLMYSLMDEAMGNSDSNGSLSVEEFESFYKNLDRFNGEGLDKEGDGIISTEAFNFPNWLIDKIFSEDTIESVIRLAFQGDI